MKIRKAKVKDLNKILEFNRFKKMKNTYWHMNPVNFVESYTENYLNILSNFVRKIT